MTAINVDFGSMAQAHDDIRATHQRLTGLVDELNAQLNPLWATWQGPGGLSSQQAHANWGNAHENLTTILYNLHVAVGANLDDYVSNEKAAELMWGG